LPWKARSAELDEALYRIESDIERLLAREGNRWGCPVAGLDPTYGQSRLPKLLAAG
jgi:hypothetical protein